MSRDGRADFIKHYFTTFATLRKYMDDTVEKAKAGERFARSSGGAAARPALVNRALRLAARELRRLTRHSRHRGGHHQIAMVAVDRRLTEEKLATAMVLTVPDSRVRGARAESRARRGDGAQTMRGVMKLDVPLVVRCGWGANWARPLNRA